MGCFFWTVVVTILGGIWEVYMELLGLHNLEIDPTTSILSAIGLNNGYGYIIFCCLVPIIIFILGLGSISGGSSGDDYIPQI